MTEEEHNYPSISELIHQRALEVQAKNSTLLKKRRIASELYDQLGKTMEAAGRKRQESEFRHKESSDRVAIALGGYEEWELNSVLHDELAGNIITDIDRWGRRIEIKPDRGVWVYRIDIRGLYSLNVMPGSQQLVDGENREPTMDELRACLDHIRRIDRASGAT